jgi:S1-C subfamily serine protease
MTSSKQAQHMITTSNAQLGPIWPFSKTQAMKAANEILGEVTACVMATDSQGNVTQGSGFLINNQFYLLTAAHVVKGAVNIKVKFQGSGILNSQVIRHDEWLDLALIFIPYLPTQNHQLPYMKLAPETAVGDVVFCGGYVNQTFQLSDGVLTHSDNVHRLIVSNLSDNGTSGGPVVGQGLRNLYGVIREDYGQTHHRTSVIPAWDVDNFLKTDPNGPQMEGFKF